MLPAALVVACTVLLLEWGMWRVFLTRVEGIHFPEASDVSQLRFFSLRRIRACVILHAAFVAVCLVLLTVYAW